MAAGRRLVVTVWVDDESGRKVAYGPGDEIPAKVAEQITNPDVWALEDDAEDEEDGGELPESVTSGDEPPPHGGKGSSAKAWRAYAAAHDVEVAEDASREDCVEACRAADVPVD